MLSTGDGCRASALTWLIFDMMRFAVRGDNAGQLFTIREQTASCYDVAHLQLKSKATQGKCEIPLSSSVVAIWSFFLLNAGEKRLCCHCCSGDSRER